MARSSAWSLLKQTYTEWSNDNASRLAAALAYYAIFSMAPLLVIAVAIGGLVLGQKAAQGQVRGQLESMVGPNAAAFVEQMIRNASHTTTGLVATVISIVLILYGATNVFVALQSALNTVWNVRVKPDRGWWAMLRERALSFLMILVIGVLLLASLVLTTAVSALTKYLASGNPWLLEAGNVVASIIVFTLLFALVFKYLPDVKVRWKDVFIGAVLTAVLFTIAKWLLGLYLSRPSTTSVYGAAGALVILLLFVYYSAQILFLGAEFTQVYARRDGRPITPKANAYNLDTPTHANEPVPPNLPPEQAGAARADNPSARTAQDAPWSASGRRPATAQKEGQKGAPGVRPAGAENGGQNGASGRRPEGGFLRRHKWSIAAGSAATVAAAGAGVIVWRKKASASGTKTYPLQPPPSKLATYAARWLAKRMAR